MTCPAEPTRLRSDELRRDKEDKDYEKAYEKAYGYTRGLNIDIEDMELVLKVHKSLHTENLALRKEVEELEKRIKGAQHTRRLKLMDEVLELKYQEIQRYDHYCDNLSGMMIVFIKDIHAYALMLESRVKELESELEKWELHNQEGYGI